MAGAQPEVSIELESAAEGEKKNGSSGLELMGQGLESEGSDLNGSNVMEDRGLWTRLRAFWAVDSTGIMAPELPLYRLFWIFFTFGLRAFGGPVAQIAMMKQQLVVEQKWVTVDRFQRVLAVYQALPGPEATELACYFGLLSRGRLGALIAGLAFILPGFSLLLLISWAYSTYGIENVHVRAVFSGIQPVVAAMIFRALLKLSEHAFQDQETKQFSMVLGFYGLLSFFLTVIEVNFFISLALCGVAHLFIVRKKLWARLIATLLILAVVAIFLAFAFNGIPGDLQVSPGISLKPTLGGIFALGLLAGLLTFGGAYTCIPFVYAGAVITGWLTKQQFLDAIAVTNILPAPLVMFVTMVGFIGEQTGGGTGFAGAVLMTLGIFLPAFSFTLIGHNVFEKIVTTGVISPFLDGVTASVMGIVLVTAFQFTKAVVLEPISAVVFFLGFAALFHFKHKLTNMLVVVVAAIASQILYVNQ